MLDFFTMTDQPRSEPRIPIRAKLAEQLQERVSKYREQRDNVASSLKRDPEHPAREKQENREVVTAAIETLAALWREFMPYIRRIKPLAGDILEPSRLSAFYFLFGKVSNGLDAIFVLAREGFYYEVMEIIRSNGEALDLVVLFQQESADGRLMKKWFEGEIIENAKAREAFDPLIGETARANNITISPKAMKSDIYSTLSRYSHVSYSALLDAYAVYHQDFDFDRDAGYHYTRDIGLAHIREQIRSATLVLRFFYRSIPEAATYHEITALARKHGLEQ